MIVKKLKYDIDGDGEETIIKIYMDSFGIFSADIPSHVKLATHKVVSRCVTLQESITEVGKIIQTYKDLKRTEKWVILIEFKRSRQPSLNEGIGMKLNYLIANKKEFGKQVTYALINKDMNGNYREVGNTISTNPFANEGIVAGNSLEIDYSEEKIKTIEDLHAKLEYLCDKLSEICNSETKFMEIVGNTFKLIN